MGLAPARRAAAFPPAATGRPPPRTWRPELARAARVRAKMKNTVAPRGQVDPVPACGKVGAQRRRGVFLPGSNPWVSVNSGQISAVRPVASVRQDRVAGAPQGLTAIRSNFTGGMFVASASAWTSPVG